MNIKLAQLSVHVHYLIFFTVFLPFLCLSLETDTISSGIVIKDPDSIVSRGHVFKLGFFAPDNTVNRYLAVYYVVSEKTPLWIANRDRPLNDSSSTVSISKDGNLELINGRNQTVWSTNATTSPLNTSVQILDNGNLVLRDDATGATMWESFSHPSDVFTQTMKISDNINTGERVVLSAWKNETDPEVGSFTAGVEARIIPQIFIWKNGRPHWRSGPWNGSLLLGLQDINEAFLNGALGEIQNDGAGTFYYTLSKLPSLSQVILNSSGVLMLRLWVDQQKNWIAPWWAPKYECDVYGRCGSFGSCNAKDSPICSCLRGFKPLNKAEWESGNWTNGCTRKNQLQCDAGGDGFVRVQFVKLPDFAEPFYSGRIEECKSRCLGNCSCIAYAHDSGIGCMFWSENLLDIQKFDGVGADIYIRLSASELGSLKHKKLIIIISVVVGSGCASIFIFFAWWWMFKRKEAKIISETGNTFSSDSNAVVPKNELDCVHIGELPLFSLEILAIATNQFHEDNLLGRGGFGRVYKGDLANGKEIGVKRLSAGSGQGAEEFMNEVSLISKLQHRNLVRLLGCCPEKGEKMLVYEYMSNKSLDICLFDPTHTSRKILDWTKRFSIIEGVARGLLYLHKDSRVKIIHRDLKPSNVLLDEDWNPKISDFGMARIFGGNQDDGNTAKVVGTRGYMAPEYAIEGRFSEKSDVYSFGVMMLEIVKGKKNIHYYNHEWSLSLLGCAWRLWSEDNGFAFVDESIGSSSDLEAEIIRCIQIGLLCVQEFPKDRPTIQTVLSMLSREIVEVPAPEQPVFAEKWNWLITESGYSINEISLTVLDGR